MAPRRPGNNEYKWFVICNLIENWLTESIAQSVHRIFQSIYISIEQFRTVCIRLSGSWANRYREMCKQMPFDRINKIWSAAQPNAINCTNHDSMQKVPESVTECNGRKFNPNDENKLEKFFFDSNTKMKLNKNYEQLTRYAGHSHIISFRCNRLDKNM